MKRFFLPFLFFAALTAGCSDQHSHDAAAPKPVKKVKPAKMIAWRDLSHIKDTVKVGEERTWNFVFYNTGVEPVRIKQALPGTSDCTCQVPAHDVQVGEQDTVKLTCKFTETGRQSCNVTVEHDTPQSFPVLVLITEVVK